MKLIDTLNRIADSLERLTYLGEEWLHIKHPLKTLRTSPRELEELLNTDEEEIYEAERKARVYADDGIYRADD